MNEASVMKEIPAQRRARDSDCMGGLRQGSTTFEELRTQAIGLRREGLSRRQIRDRLKVGNNDLLNRLLKGEPAPEWTKRPRAKDGMKAKARAFRLEGWTYDQIEMELGVSRSSISLWVRDPPKPTPRTREEASAISKRGWEVTLRKREEERQRVKARSAQEIDHLSDRELFLIGVGLYWAEGSKSKPYRRHEAVTFINSDPDMIRVYLAWLDLLGVAGDRRRFSVMIHESADVESAERYWADLVGRDVTEFGKTTSKRHNPKTVRKNVGSDYRGCLVVRVLQGADLYRRIEGWWSGVAAQCRPADGLRRSGMV
jgi:transcriptional regulator with XRE-family HTH domain